MNTPLVALSRNLSLSAVALCASAVAGAQSPTIDRTVLPVAEPARPVYTEIDARNVTSPPHFQVTAPAGAPNVIVIREPAPATFLRG